MPQYNGIVVALVNQFDGVDITEYLPPPHSPIPFTTRENEIFLDKENSILSVYSPSNPSAQVWIKYSIPEPDPFKLFYFKLHVNNKHIVSWGCGKEQEFEGTMMFALTQDKKKGGLIKQALRFASKERSSSKHDEVKITVFRAKGREPTQPGYESFSTDCDEVDDQEIVFDKGTGDLKTASGKKHVFGKRPDPTNKKTSCVFPSVDGRRSKKQPATHYQYSLYDSLDRPLVTFRYLVRSSQYLKEIGAINEYRHGVQLEPAVEYSDQPSSSSFDSAVEYTELETQSPIREGNNPDHADDNHENEKSIPTVWKSSPRMAFASPSKATTSTDSKFEHQKFNITDPSNFYQNSNDVFSGIDSSGSPTWRQKGKFKLHTAHEPIFARYGGPSSPTPAGQNFKIDDKSGGVGSSKFPEELSNDSDSSSDSESDSDTGGEGESSSKVELNRFGRPHYPDHNIALLSAFPEDGVLKGEQDENQTTDHEHFAESSRKIVDPWDSPSSRGTSSAPNLSPKRNTFSPAIDPFQTPEPKEKNSQKFVDQWDTPSPQATSSAANLFQERNTFVSPVDKYKTPEPKEKKRVRLAPTLEAEDISPDGGDVPSPNTAANGSVGSSRSSPHGKTTPGNHPYYDPKHFMKPLPNPHGANFSKLLITPPDKVIPNFSKLRMEADTDKPLPLQPTNLSNPTRNIPGLSPSTPSVRSFESDLPSRASPTSRLAPAKRMDLEDFAWSPEKEPFMPMNEEFYPPTNSPTPGPSTTRRENLGAVFEYPRELSSIERLRAKVAKVSSERGPRSKLDWFTSLPSGGTLTWTPDVTPQRPSGSKAYSPETSSETSSEDSSEEASQFSPDRVPEIPQLPLELQTAPEPSSRSPRLTLETRPRPRSITKSQNRNSGHYRVYPVSTPKRNISRGKLNSSTGRSGSKKASRYTRAASTPTRQPVTHQKMKKSSATRLRELFKRADKGKQRAQSEEVEERSSWQTEESKTRYEVPRIPFLSRTPTPTRVPEASGREFVFPERSQLANETRLPEQQPPSRGLGGRKISFEGLRGLAGAMGFRKR